MIFKLDHRYLRLAYGEKLTNDIFYFISLGKNTLILLAKKKILGILQIWKSYSQVFKIQIKLKYPREEWFAHTLQFKY